VTTDPTESGRLHVRPIDIVHDELMAKGAADHEARTSAELASAAAIRAAALRDFLFRLEQSAGDAAAEKLLDDNPELAELLAAVSVAVPPAAAPVCKFEEGCHRVEGCDPGCAVTAARMYAQLAAVPPTVERRDRYAAAMAKRDGDTWPAEYENDEADYRRRADAAMAVADAEQADLRREHAERLEHLEGALARIRDKGEVVQVRGRKVLAYAEEIIATSGPGVASAVQAVVDRLRAALDGEPAFAAAAVLPQPETQAGHDVVAAECSAQHRTLDDGRLCIRAAQHRGDHIDERGFHWSDTVAVYPVSDGTFRIGTDVRAALRAAAAPAVVSQPDEEATR
jgi:hypothetical protein